MNADENNIHGIGLDRCGRCAHYHGSCDVAALKCAHCQKYYACYQCHDELEDHLFAATGGEEPYPVICGNCGARLRRDEYLSGACPSCGTRFNPRCGRHAHIYFK